MVFFMQTILTDYALCFSHRSRQEEIQRFRYNQGMPELISSFANPLVKQIRSLRQKKGREETGLFLVEGIHPVGEAVEAGWPVEALVYSPDLLTSDFANGLVAKQIQLGVHCVALTRTLFNGIADKDNPQGLLAILHQRQLLLDSIPPTTFQWGVALVSPQDPGNVGTILRTLDSVGADGLFLLDGGVDPYHPSVVRASMGTLFWKPVVQVSFDEFVHWGHKHGFHLVGSSAHGGTDYREYQWGNKPTILLLGNEQKGLTPEQLASCKAVVCMPMKGRVSSLNLGVAAGVLMYRMMENK
jgi:TrmH family RNA methyltransferase